jgi:GPH family glycoside/pentoside/hexuronide:cation symporter
LERAEKIVGSGVAPVDPAGGARTGSSGDGSGSAARTIDALPSHLTASSLVTYALPTAGLGFVYYLAILKLMLFATDVLLIAPVVVSGILLASRVIDAITDPLAGYLSDRTRSRLGRRRPWLLGSAPLVALVVLMMWAPPRGLEGGLLVAWMAVGIVGFYAAVTFVNVPHLSWGAELSPDYHERNRIFGTRLLLQNVGVFAAVGLLAFTESFGDQRTVMFWVAIAAGVTVVGTTTWTSLRLPEREDFRALGPDRPWQAIRDVLGNAHARLLLTVYFIESLGGAVIGVLTPYMGRYVLHMPWPSLVLTYMLAMTLTLPLWSPLARRLGKKHLWLFSMVGTALGFGSFFALGPGDDVVAYGLAAFLGIAAGCGNVVAPSVQSDIVDFDEHATGERKEGGYFAAFNFAQKTAAGMTLLITGVVLSASGYQANLEQTETARLAIQSLYALFPLSCYLVGALLFLRFTFNEGEHALVRDQLDARRENGGGDGSA